MLWLTCRCGSSPLARGSQLHRLGQVRVVRLIPAGAGLTSDMPAPSSRRRAHPRWRGAHAREQWWIDGWEGSSPLARGSPDGLGEDREGDGLIPAGAGLTRRPPTASSRRRAHPRWRGAHAAYNAYAAGNQGSSPLARGSRPGLPAARPGRGLIPAGAGLTMSMWLLVPPPEGSSPLARGSRSDRVRRRDVRRLIPAGAGLTCASSTTAFQHAAHPRWRGAHRAALRRLMARDGSSPLARGSLDGPVVGAVLVGLIPAGAGLTRGQSGRRRGREAHPRWRGAHLRSPPRNQSFTGSSPLARGSPPRGRVGRGDGRLIPAGAGLTRRSITGSRAGGAHPRWRGAHLTIADALAIGEGSSPLARGSLSGKVTSRWSRRLIPAGAGLT